VDDVELDDEDVELDDEDVELDDEDVELDDKDGVGVEGVTVGVGLGDGVASQGVV